MAERAGDRGGEWGRFGWQGIQLSVPEDWDLGKVDGDYNSGYARLDDAEIVRAEVEWRTAPKGRQHLPVGQLVDRYLGKLEKKAAKEHLDFAVHRRARILTDKRWLEGCDHETFVWESDYRAYNLAKACPTCGRIVLLRVLCQLGETAQELADNVFRSLLDHGADDSLFWCVYGMTFCTPADYKLISHELRSGHIQLTFEQKGHVCRLQRLSMASLLLKGTTLQEWYPAFFKKQLRDIDFEVLEALQRGHEGLTVTGHPRSRWRQLLRPLPFVNPRPRQYLDARVWHCGEANKICVAEHLYRKRDQRGILAETLTNGFTCHEEGAETDPGGDAQLPSGAQ